MHTPHPTPLDSLLAISYRNHQKNLAYFSHLHGRPQKKMQGGQKHSRDSHLSESYSQVSVSDRVTN